MVFPLSNFLPELYYDIFKFLTIDDLCNLSQTNTNLRNQIKKLMSCEKKANQILYRKEKSQHNDTYISDLPYLYSSSNVLQYLVENGVIKLKPTIGFDAVDCILNHFKALNCRFRLKKCVCHSYPQYVYCHINATLRCGFEFHQNRL